jgi:hypothetical protein
VQQFGGEAAVVQVEPAAVLVPVPHARTKQDDVADRQLKAPGAADVYARTPGHDGDLDEAVGVPRMDALVQIVARVRDRSFREMQLVARALDWRFQHVSTIRPGRR